MELGRFPESARFAHSASGGTPSPARFAPRGLRRGASMGSASPSATATRRRTSRVAATCSAGIAASTEPTGCSAVIGLAPRNVRARWVSARDSRRESSASRWRRSRRSATSRLIRPDDRAGVQVQDRGEPPRRQPRQVLDQAEHQALLPGDAGLLVQPPRPRVQVVVDGPEQAEELQGRAEGPRLLGSEQFARSGHASCLGSHGAALGRERIAASDASRTCGRRSPQRSVQPHDQDRRAGVLDQRSRRRCRRGTG